MKIRSVLAFLAAALCFTASALLVKANFQLFAVGAIPAIIARFALGMVGMFLWARTQGSDLRPHRPALVIWRGVLNALAVLLLFVAVTMTTVTKANLFNQLYPAFILLFAPIINRERIAASSLIWLAVSLGGVFLVALPATGITGLVASGDLAGDLVGIASGVVAAAAISVLREARKTDSTQAVIFWQFAAGLAFSLFLLPFCPPMPADPLAWLLLVLTGLSGFVGQVLMTWGYRYQTAASGGLILNAGVVFTACAGTLLFGDPLLPSLIVGAVLILTAIVALGGPKLRPRARAEAGGRAR